MPSPLGRAGARTSWNFALSSWPGLHGHLPIILCWSFPVNEQMPRLELTPRDRGMVQATQSVDLDVDMSASGGVVVTGGLEVDDPQPNSRQDCVGEALGVELAVHRVEVVVDGLLG